MQVIYIMASESVALSASACDMPTEIDSKIL